MPGTQVFTYANFGKETTRGTAVAPTRQFYSEGTGLFTQDLGLNFHEGENTGIRLRTRRVTQTKEDVTWNARTVTGVGYDDLVIPFSQLKGAQTGAGAGADKTWTFTPSWTAANNPEAYSIDVGDDTQNWRIAYGMVQSFKLSAALGDVTSLDMSGFGKSATKVAKAAPAANSAVKIPGDFWSIKFAANIAGLGAASVQANLLQAFDLEIQTGLKWRHYMDGTLQGAQHVETDIAATLTMTVESTAFTISEFYDKAAAQTMDFLRLKATGPALGGSNYSAQIDMPVLYEVPQILSGQDDGVNLYQVVAHLAYDGTNGIVPVIVNSIAALP